MRYSSITVLVLAASVALALPIELRQNPANNHLKDDGPELCGDDKNCGEFQISMTLLA